MGAFGKLYASPVLLERFEADSGTTNRSNVRLELNAAFGVECQAPPGLRGRMPGGGGQDRSELMAERKRAKGRPEPGLGPSRRDHPRRGSGAQGCGAGRRGCRWGEGTCAPVVALGGAMVAWREIGSHRTGERNVSVEGPRMRAPRPVSSGAVLVATLLIGVVFTGAAQAAPGDLDPTFSADGKQTTDFVGSSWARATVRQPDGKIIAVGNDTVPPDYFALARYNPNGSLDTSFSGDGKQRTSFGRNDQATGVALHPNGKIVVAGIAEVATGASTGEAFPLTRSNPN